MKLLVVDDAEIMRKAIKAWAERMCKHTVTVASTAEEAIELLQQEAFDGVTIDGLYGAWRKVSDAATAAGVECICGYTGSDVILQNMKNEGLLAILKPNLSGLMDALVIEDPPSAA